jgi:hypothetical protein
MALDNDQDSKVDINSVKKLSMMSPSSMQTLTARATTASVVGRRLGGGRIRNVNQVDDKNSINDDLRSINTPTAQMMMSSQASLVHSYKNTSERPGTTPGVTGINLKRRNKSIGRL